MKVIVTERQLKRLSTKNRHGEFTEQAATSSPEDAQPTSGASDTQTGDQKGYPTVSKWEDVVGSMVSRGAANQIKNTKWSDTVGSLVSRGAANQLSEQPAPPQGNYTSPKTKQTYNPNKLPVFNPSYNLPPKDELSFRQGADEIQKSAKPSSINQNERGQNVINFDALGGIESGILKVRNFFFTSWEGMATELIIATVGESIGGMAIIEFINVVCSLNDLKIYNEYGSNIYPSIDEINKWKTLNKNIELETFSWLLKNNPYYFNIMIDFLFILTGIVFRTVKSVFKYCISPKSTFIIPKGGVPIDITTYQYSALRQIKIQAQKITDIPLQFQNWTRSNIKSVDETYNVLESIKIKTEKSSSKLVQTLGKTLRIPKILIESWGLWTITAWIMHKAKKEGVQITDQYAHNAIIEFQNSTNEELIQDFYEMALPQFPGLKIEQFRIYDRETKNGTLFMINNEIYYINGIRGNIYAKLQTVNDTEGINPPQLSTGGSTATQPQLRLSTDPMTIQNNDIYKNKLK